MFISISPYSEASFSIFNIELLVSRTFLHIQKQPLDVFCKKKVFLELSQNSQESTCASVSFLIILQALLKKRLWHRCFPVNFAKFLRTPLNAEHLRWLLLHIHFPVNLCVSQDIRLKT